MAFVGRFALSRSAAAVAPLRMALPMSLPLRLSCAPSFARAIGDRPRTTLSLAAPLLRSVRPFSHSAPRAAAAAAAAAPATDAKANKMFCFQCEQTESHTGCTSIGVCGKLPTTAGLQDTLVAACKAVSVYAHRARTQPVPKSDRAVDRFVVDALFSTMTNVNFDDARMVAYIRQADRMRARARALCADQTADAEADGLDLTGDAAALLARAKPLGVEARRELIGPDLNGLAEMAVYGLKGTCAYADHARQLGTERDGVYAAVHRTLALVGRTRDLNGLVAINMGVGALNLEVMQMLEDAHTTRFGHPVPTQVPTMPRPNAKAILVSGHDLHDLEDILKQSAGKGIDVYTHGEMLPAHGYPKLKAFKNLAGHYGGPWQLQKMEFARFPGAIVMTSNCLIEPQRRYKDRLFTRRVVGWPGVRHIEDASEADGEGARPDFSPVIAAALSSPGFGDDALDEFPRLPPLTVGFGHNAILSVADKVIAAANYFRELARQSPKDSLILTLGCGKYRINQLPLGELALGPGVSVPRVLDMGQCNDAIGAVTVASALAKALNCSVNDLPLSLALSWFGRWLNDPARADSFQDVAFCQFGLGQSTHYPEQYQKVSRDVEQRLLQLRAKPFAPRGVGDSAVDVEADFEEWSRTLIARVSALSTADVQRLFPGAAATNADAPGPAAPPPPAGAPPASPSPSSAPVSGAPSAGVRLSWTPDIRRPYPCLIVGKRELVNSNWLLQPRLEPPPLALHRDRSCLALDVALPLGMSYQTGDYFGVFPVNDQHSVDSLMRRLNADPTARLPVRDSPILRDYAQFRLTSSSPVAAMAAPTLGPVMPDPDTISVGSILAHVLDIHAVPRRSLLRALAECASDPAERAKLTFLSTEAGSGSGAGTGPQGLSALAAADFESFIVRPRRTLIDVLAAFQSVHLTASQLVDLLPPLQCRYYSIASSSLLQPQTVSLTVGVLEYVTSFGRLRRGVASSYLSSRRVGDRVFGFVKKSLFRLPNTPAAPETTPQDHRACAPATAPAGALDLNRPIIMIAAGTGIAPFRAFVAERAALRKQAMGGCARLRSSAPDVLLFGLMNRSLDFYHQTEFEAAAAASAVDETGAGEAAVRVPALRVIVAPSHEQPWHVFVQHKMVEPETRRLLWDLIDAHGANIYVCGEATGMARGVMDALTHIVEKEGGRTPAQAKTFLEQMQAANRLQLDVF